MLLVHARRTGVVPEQHRSRIFNVRTPHSVNTFLVDGRVAGTWRYADGEVRLEPFELENYLHLGAPDSADMVVTFRNMHDLMVQNVHGEESDHFLMAFLRNAYQVLKPGGILGIVSHRANPDMPLWKCFHLARLPQPFLIHAAEEAGFKFGGASEINANPKDTRAKPVFWFPPALSKASGDQAHYKALGEADNMTLRFIKPGAPAR